MASAGYGTWSWRRKRDPTADHSISNTVCAPLVRIPALRREYVKRILDFRAAGGHVSHDPEQEKLRRLADALPIEKIGKIPSLRKNILIN